LREEELIGTYGQPRWTASRRFPSTRVYVIPEGKVEMEYWYRPTFTRDNKVETRMLAEVEFGLPHRFQVDLYFRTDQDDAGSQMKYGDQIELRWALADWGKIWGNPTLYFEYLNLDKRAGKIEPKLLLGGEIAEGWHWGVNFVAELEIDGDTLEHEYEFTSGLSRTIFDDTFSAGASSSSAWSTSRAIAATTTRPSTSAPPSSGSPFPACSSIWRRSSAWGASRHAARSR